MNTHHIVIKNINSFIDSRNQNRDLVLGFDVKHQMLKEIKERNSKPYVITIGNIPAWRDLQDILDIMFNNILSNPNVKIDNDGLYFKNYFMKWGN